MPIAHRLPPIRPVAVVPQAGPARARVDDLMPSDLLWPGNGDGGNLAAAAHRRREARISGPPAAIVPPDRRNAVANDMVSKVPKNPASTIRHVRLKPGTVNIGGDWPEFRRAMVGNTLSLGLVTPEMLNALDDDRMYELLETLGRSRQVATWHLRRQKDQRRHLLPHRSRHAELTAVSALALLMWSRSAPEASTRLLLWRPVEVAHDLADAVPGLFSLSAITDIFMLMIPRITSPEVEWEDPEDEQINAMGSMIQAFLTQNAQERPELVEMWVVALMQRLEMAGFETNSENLGLLAGTVLAGAYKYSKTLKAYDQKRYYVIDKTSLLVFAATAFIPLDPVTGALSMVAVISGILLERFYPIRDFNKFVTQLEGRLRIRLLKLKIFESPLELPMLMEWLVGALRCNDLTE